MAAPEATSPIDILRKGVEVWNEWRRANSRARPLLYGADLRERNLCGADQRGAQLVQTRLAKAKLDGADMRNANLSGASLREASLRLLILGRFGGGHLERLKEPASQAAAVQGASSL